MLAGLALVLYPLPWLVASSVKPSGEIVGDLEPPPETPTVGDYTSAMEGIGGVPPRPFFRNSLLLPSAAVLGILLPCPLNAYAPGRMTSADAALCAAH